MKYNLNHDIITITEEDLKMKRCCVCDSTEFNDTLAEDGIDQPISYWQLDKETGEQYCNRCYESIKEAIEDFGYDEEE
ncbi:MAG: hypothetical protein KDD45_02400 [Bdellovibrionales bacterium]|nr:hypothetical protein [Bdellovibrionales bacterium]